MRVLCVGATGLLGRAVSAALAGHEVVAASRSVDPRVDLTDPASIGALYEAVGPVDAVVCCAGHAPFKPFGSLTLDDYRAGVGDKLLGQVELVRAGVPHVADGGSFTLVSGVTSEDPIVGGTAAAVVNGALDAFVRSAAIELPRGLRLNSVSATVFEEAWESFGPYFPGHRPVPVAEVARAFVKSVAGRRTGQVHRVGY